MVGYHGVTQVEGWSKASREADLTGETPQEMAFDLQAGCERNSGKSVIVVPASAGVDHGIDIGKQTYSSIKNGGFLAKKLNAAMNSDGKYIDFTSYSGSKKEW